MILDPVAVIEKIKNLVIMSMSLLNIVAVLLLELCLLV